MATFFVQGRSFNPDQALVSEWQSVDFLFQLTDSEIQSNAHGSLVFDSKDSYDGSAIQSYLFFAIDLKRDHFTRTQLAGITRAVNRLFDMPALLLFKHGDTITLSIIRRRLHKKDEAKDVLEKVTLIRDVSFADPLRAHVDILNDLSFTVLRDEFYFHNFAGLHAAWEKRLDSYALNERFYREIADWYFWALRYPEVIYPRDVVNDEQCSIFLIRLLTRLIFCWFLQEKGLIPRDLFRPRYVERMLKDCSPRAGSYYRAFVQNLFFATLNQEQDKRGFRRRHEGTRDGNRGVTNLYRYAHLLTDADAFAELLRQVPFVNGGLFDCLDVVYDRQGTPNVRLDDFSEEKANMLSIPNELFFGADREVDLTEVYKDKRHKKEHVRGLIDILGRYKFTVEENTPLEQEIALDPELLGKVFENLLASYNEDTSTTARKATGSFYTPREIVNYMVDEALVTYLQSSLARMGSNNEMRDADLRSLLKGEIADLQNRFSEEEKLALITAIDGVKILDPACGSGAFPMGVLHRLVDLLRKLDPNNRHWKEQQLTKAVADHMLAERMQDEENRRNALEDVETRIADIERSFDTRFHALDFARKLYLIENCLYGVDIQPIACQIAKLRFFIALIVDQQVDNAAPNRGVRPLPNLETKIVAADTLVPIERKVVQGDMFAEDSGVVVKIDGLRKDLEQVRHEYFGARTPAKKRKCRDQDEVLRTQIASLLRETGLDAPAAKILASWDPYDQNAHATFFDPEWMFGVPVGKMRISQTSSGTLKGHFSFINEIPGQMELADKPFTVENGFDVVIGNPPYVRIQTLKQKDPEMAKFLKEQYESASKGNYDVYVVFVERGLQLLKPTGNLAFILPHKFFNAKYGEPIRGLIARGKYLNHVVHFGGQQVFPGLTNYVCLLFLRKSHGKEVRFAQVDNLDDWLSSKKSDESMVAAKNITSAEWNFVTGRKAPVLERITEGYRHLSDVAARIFQGLVTGADQVFIMHPVSEGRYYSKATGTDQEIEASLMHPLCKGSVDIRRWRIGPLSKSILFPYHVVNDSANLISPDEFRQLYPQAWTYLQSNRRTLEAREDGKWHHEAWYAFGRSQNLARMETIKILTPSIAPFASYTLDIEGRFYFVGSGGGGGGGYGITLRPDCGLNEEFVLALLNSTALDFCLKSTSTLFSGGYYAYNRQYIENLPIPTATDAQQAKVSGLTRYLLQLHQQKDSDTTELSLPRDHLMLGYFEQLINGLVYELFLPEELHGHSLFLFKLVEEAQLPELETIPESERLALLRETFERIYDLNHPIRGALHTLRSLETIRVIEGDT
jgi:adenine-specific DNA-methyltransferase